MTKIKVIEGQAIVCYSKFILTKPYFEAYKQCKQINIGVLCESFFCFHLNNYDLNIFKIQSKHFYILKLINKNNFLKVIVFNFHLHLLSFFLNLHLLVC